MHNGGQKQITLSELSSVIKETLDEHLEISYWVIAEIAEYKVNSFSGHCYLELVEKEEGANTINARMRATIWSAAFRMLKPFFETSTGIELGTGLKVMVRGVVEYHEVYGISLNIRDIDPAYTVGEMAMRMQQTIDLLTKDGVIDMNRELELPLLPKTVAVISSSGAAGLQDFMNQLEHNTYGYHFQVKLFEAVMQGEKAPGSIMDALHRVFEYAGLFDAVLVLRGGGAVLDLNCFNDYELCFMAAQFPIPLLTGIGHDKDETVLDLVAHTKLKTPTAVAEYLVGCFTEFDAKLNQLADGIFSGTEDILIENRNRLMQVITQLKPVTQQRLRNEKFGIESLTKEMHGEIHFRLAEQKSLLQTYSRDLNKGSLHFAKNKADNLAKITDRLQTSARRKIESSSELLERYTLKIEYQDPVKILEKGYSITTRNGAVVTRVSDLRKGDKIITVLSDGKKQSTVD
ncbi:exodeoxyribonuclease VII large subunit [Saccharicrinis sp. FJH54]|uniref:exodeoxyribonuclease VII large subunit n=1 Tax=Saccharicrinis sp. FJH54 TaxID=3344665 RepID=UPI0035D48016